MTSPEILRKTYYYVEWSRDPQELAAGDTPPLCLVTDDACELVLSCRVKLTFSRKANTVCRIATAPKDTA
jgi:hypothetical protein